MSEEAAVETATETPVTEAAAPPPVEPETPPAEPAPPAPEPPKTAEFQALARARGKLHKLEQDVKQRESGLQSRVAEIDAREQKIAPLLRAMEKFEEDPESFLTAFASSKGVDAQHFFNTLVTKLAHKGEPPDPNDRVSKLEEQIRAKEAAEKAAREKEAEERRAAGEAEGRKKIEAFLASDPEKYERISERLTSDDGKGEIHNHLMQMAKWYSDQGKDLSLELAAQNLEAWYESQDKDRLVRLLGSKKLTPPEPQSTNDSATPTKPAEPAPAEQAAPAQQPPKSLPKSIPTGRATVPAAGGRAVQRTRSDDSEKMVSWAKRLAEANAKKAG